MDSLSTDNYQTRHQPGRCIEQWQGEVAREMDRIIGPALADTCDPTKVDLNEMYRTGTSPRQAAFSIIRAQN